MDFWGGHRVYSVHPSCLSGPGKVLVGSCKAGGQVGVVVDLPPFSSSNENAITVIASPE